jgi:LPS sulfotransferase NodH
MENIKKNSRSLFKLFKEPLNQERLERLDEISVETYLVAITPRSGSSYFIDLLDKTSKMGEPGEYLNPNLIPNIAEVLQANDFSDYWVKLINRKARESCLGVKASFFQFLPLIETEIDELLFNNSKMILLKRQNIVKQGISLYLATQSDIFHTNIEHSEEKWKLLKTIEYSDKQIQSWIEHIHIQELGWGKYLRNKDYLSLWYEDIVKDPKNCIINTLDFLNREYLDDDVVMTSIFKKLGNDKNQEFYEVFLSKKSNLEYLEKLNILEKRFVC